MLDEGIPHSQTTPGVANTLFIFVDRARSVPLER